MHRRAQAQAPRHSTSAAALLAPAAGRGCQQACTLHCVTVWLLQRCFSTCRQPTSSGARTSANSRRWNWRRRRRRTPNPAPPRLHPHLMKRYLLCGSPMCHSRPHSSSGGGRLSPGCKMVRGLRGQGSEPSLAAANPLARGVDMAAGLGGAPPLLEAHLGRGGRGIGRGAAQGNVGPKPKSIQTRELVCACNCLALRGLPGGPCRLGARWRRHGIPAAAIAWLQAQPGPGKRPSSAAPT